MSQLLNRKKIENMKTLVFGASRKPERYSNMAIRKLLAFGHEVFAIGGREAEVEGVQILTGHPHFEDIHTITMYMGAGRQTQHFDYFFSLKPKRIIFNPGAENAELYNMANEKGIIVENACTLVMLSTDEYEKEKGRESHAHHM